MEFDNILDEYNKAVENNNNAVKILGILNDKLKKLRENNSVEELKKKTKNLNINLT